MNRTVNTLCASIVALFMTACAGKAPIRVTHTDMLEDDCAIMRRTIITSGDDAVQNFKQFVGFSKKCADYQLLATLLKYELDNPETEAIVTSSMLEMLAEESPPFKKSLMRALGRYGITEEKLTVRKEIDDAIQEVRSTPEKDCTQIAPGQFYCE